MTATRREFIRLMLVGSSALAIGWDLRADDGKTPFTPNGWIELDAAGHVTLTVGKSEMGQGVRTSLAMILAEELGAEWGSVTIRQASPSDTNRGLGTGGSWSIRGSWKPLRTAGAAAREMLVAVAAARLGVDPTSLRTQDGAVIHDASGRRLLFGELVSDAAKQPVPQTPALKPASTFTIVGRRTKRVDASAIVSGKAVYGLDARVPDMHYATIVRPPVLGGSIRSFDATETKKVFGVTHVLRVPSGIAVVARDSWAALKGRQALKIETDDGPHADFDSAKHHERLTTAATLDGIVLRRDGDAPAAFASAARTFKARYLYPFYAHAPVEPMNCTAHVQDGSCEIWSPTQAPNDVQDRVSQLLGIPRNAVKVNVTLLGGGFGRRLWWDYDLEAVEVSRAAGKPVKLFWTRQDDMHHGYFQAASLHDLAAAVDANGTITAWRHKKVSTPHNARRPLEPEQLHDPEFLRGSAWGVYDLPYAIPAIDCAYVPLETHVPIGPWRSVFAPSSIFARECFLDELAHALKKDPFQLRVDLLNGAESIKAEDLTIDRRRARRVLELLREKSQWDKPLPAGRSRGVAFSIYDGEIHVGYVAEITITNNVVNVERVVCAIDCGMVVNPLGLEAQVESGIIWGLSSALKGEITFTNGHVTQSTFGDFDVLRITETPRIETHIIPSQSPDPFGAGEPTVPAIIPAVLNAIFAATGKRLRRIPIRPEDLA
ncbi:MAG: isoquinoline 1-oxidoreductase subunit beta [Acidobacteriota bacterium]|nr:isoquinoline 1-oxidoreductase subunit beta [Acidobacteriota bacterium]